MSRPLTDADTWDEVLAELDDFSGFVWFAITTGPGASLVPGIVRSSAGMLADITRRDPAAVLGVLEHFARRGWIFFDTRLRLIAMNAGPLAPPENGNVLKAWWKAWQALPESPVKYRHVARLKAAVTRGAPALTPVWSATFGTVEGQAAPSSGADRYPPDGGLIPGGVGIERRSDTPSTGYRTGSALSRASDPDPSGIYSDPEIPSGSPPQLSPDPDLSGQVEIPRAKDLRVGSAPPPTDRSPGSEPAPLAPPAPVGSPVPPMPDAAAPPLLTEPTIRAGAARCFSCGTPTAAGGFDVPAHDGATRGYRLCRRCWDAHCGLVAAGHERALSGVRPAPRPEAPAAPEALPGRTLAVWAESPEAAPYERAHGPGPLEILESRGELVQVKLPDGRTPWLAASLLDVCTPWPDTSHHRVEAGSVSFGAALCANGCGVRIRLNPDDRAVEFSAPGCAWTRVAPPCSAAAIAAATDLAAERAQVLPAPAPARRLVGWSPGLDAKQARGNVAAYGPGPFELVEQDGASTRIRCANGETVWLAAELFAAPHDAPATPPRGSGGHRFPEGLFAAGEAVGCANGCDAKVRLGGISGPVEYLAPGSAWSLGAPPCVPRHPLADLAPAGGPGLADGRPAPPAGSRPPATAPTCSGCGALLPRVGLDGFGEPHECPPAGKPRGAPPTAPRKRTPKAPHVAAPAETFALALVEPPVEAKPALERYAEAYAAGQMDAGAVGFRPPLRAHQVFVETLPVFAKSADGALLRGAELDAWIRASSAEYRRAIPFGEVKWQHSFAPAKWAEWLEGRTAPKPRFVVPEGPQQENVPPVPPGSKAQAYIDDLQAEADRDGITLDAAIDRRFREQSLGDVGKIVLRPVKTIAERVAEELAEKARRAAEQQPAVGEA